MNYDFEKCWENRIMPLLKTERIQKAIKKGITAWLDNKKKRLYGTKLLTKKK